MTVLTRGARSRRRGRRPGWLLLTVLLVLAIMASSALVFTNRVELLKLAVILALWAAVVAAFVSVIYRRQSDVDQAKARDLKLVYDLQLDREISARRAYELTVESELRRELASELRAQAADEVAALRAELAALRANLEFLFDTDLSHRPAIETERTTVRAVSDWALDAQSAGRVSSSRIDADENPNTRTEENPIIDVPAEPHAPEHEWTATPLFGGAHRRSSEAEPTPEERSSGRRSNVQPNTVPPRSEPPPSSAQSPSTRGEQHLAEQRARQRSSVRQQAAERSRSSERRKLAAEIRPPRACSRLAACPRRGAVDPGRNAGQQLDRILLRRMDLRASTSEGVALPSLRCRHHPRSRALARHSVPPDATDPDGRPQPPPPPTLATPPPQPAPPAAPAEEAAPRHRSAEEVASPDGTPPADIPSPSCWPGWKSVRREAAVVAAAKSELVS